MEIVELIENNMLDYAGAVNQSRAIPDARTGLKPIHRKVLYEMYADKIKSSGKYKKCAFMVGQIIARFSEHGDTATYDALVRLAQPWIQRYPLLDFHGNYGSQFGDSQAAMRYTESKLSTLAEQGMLSGLDKKNVDWIPNFTQEEEEPITLPAIFPGLFCLPNQGMGYAAACHFVTYNLNDVAQYINAVANNKKELPVIYPDFASGGTLINPQIAGSVQKTGKGSFILEGKYHIKDNQIIFTEIPFNIMFNDIYNSIIELCKNGELTFITNLINDSGQGKMKLIIEVDDKDKINEYLEIIFNKTKLRNSYPVNQTALVDNKVKLINFKEMAEIYIQHNSDCIRREFDYDFGRARKRILIIEGLLKAISQLDHVIHIIRKSNSPKEDLIGNIELNEEQAQAVLDMRLGRLSKLENEKLEKELQEKKDYAAYCESVINSTDKQKEVLIQRLQELVKKYGDERRTNVVQKDIKKISAGKAKEKVEEIPQDIVVTYDSNGYIKAVPVVQYKKSKNFLGDEFKCTTKDLILLFSSLGKCYRISAKDVGLSAANDKGKIVTTIVQAEKNEKIVKVLPNILDDKYPYVTSTTSDGKIKKTDKVDLMGTTRNLRGIKYIGLDNNEVFWCGETNGDYIHIGTTDGYNIAFELEDIRATGKTSKGVIAIKLNEGARINTCELNIKPKGIEITKRAGKGKKI